MQFGELITFILIKKFKAKD